MTGRLRWRLSSPAPPPPQVVTKRGDGRISPVVAMAASGGRAPVSGEEAYVSMMPPFFSGGEILASRIEARCGACVRACLPDPALL